MKRYLGMVAGGSGTRDSFCDCAAIHDIPSAAREARELPKVWLYMQSASTAFRQGLGEWLTFTMALRGADPRCAALAYWFRTETLCCHLDQSMFHVKQHGEVPAAG